MQGDDKIVDSYAFFSYGGALYIRTENGETKSKWTGRWFLDNEGVRVTFTDNAGKMLLDDTLTLADLPTRELRSRHFSSTFVADHYVPPEDREIEKATDSFISGVRFHKKQLVTLGWRLGNNLNLTYEVKKSDASPNGLTGTIFITVIEKSYSASATYAWKDNRWSFLKADAEKLDPDWMRALQELPEFMWLPPTS